MPNEPRSSPWRQGHVLPEDAIRTLNLADPGASDGAIAVLITHDCDVVADQDREPSVEIMTGTRIRALDGNATHGKSARTLHLGFHRDGDLIPVQLRARDKRPLDKHALRRYAPDAAWSLDADNLSILQRWLASRYRRAAFPEAFEACLQKTQLDKALVNVVKPLGALVRAVYFDVTEPQESETAEGPAYDLGIVLVYDAYQREGSAEVEKAAVAIAKRFRKTLEHGGRSRPYAVEFRSCEAVSDEALTYKQSLELKQWRLDYLSLRDDPQQSMPD